MEKPFQASLKYALLISTIPLSLKGTSLILGCLQSTLFHKGSLNPSGGNHFISWINDQLISNSVYSSYLVFMGTMLILSLLISLLKKVGSYQSSPNQEKHLVTSQETSLTRLQVAQSGFSRKDTLDKFGRFMICFTLIFGIIQLVSFIVTNNLSFKNDLEGQQQALSLSSRNLGEQVSSVTEEDAEKFLLPSATNAGQVFGSFHYDAKDANKMAFIISHDGKTLFVFESQWFNIYDISDPKKTKFIACSYDFGYWLQSVSIVISPDDQYLYIHSLTHFHIIPLSNMYSLKPCYSEELNIPFTNLQALISMTISPDGKTLYLLREQNITFHDISEPCRPSQIYYKEYKSTRNLKSIPRSSPRIALSKNSSLVAIESIPALEILDISDLSQPETIYRTSLEGSEQIFSVTFSDDENKLLLGVLDKDSNVSLQILNITDIKSPSLPYYLTVCLLNIHS